MTEALRLFCQQSATWGTILGREMMKRTSLVSVLYLSVLFFLSSFSHECGRVAWVVGL